MSKNMKKETNIVYYPDTKKFGLTTKQCIHTRKLIVKGKLNGPINDLANASDEQAKVLCGNSSLCN